jgi:glycosyltransferase involved in cell wall biosynthesis
LREVVTAGDAAVSVIVSTHNRADYLRDVLSTLAAQVTEAAFEVIVIDNASTDRTSTVLERWCREDSRFRSAYEPRLGLSCGKNAGVRLARAPLLLFTDDDTLVDRRWIQSYVDLFKRRSAEPMLAGGPHIPIPHDLGPWPDWLDEPALADVALLDYHQERRLSATEWVWGANMAVPRALFDRFGMWDETVGRQGSKRGTFEDTEFQDRVRARGGAVWFCPAAVVRHRVCRETVTPRHVSSKAFTRGRNDMWRRSLPVWREIPLVPKRNAAKAMTLLAGSLLSWSLWTIAFRLFPRKSFFERARRAAFTSGNALESLRAGRSSARLYFAMSRVAFGARGIVLRLSPNVA